MQLHVLIETQYKTVTDDTPQWHPMTSCNIAPELVPNVYGFAMRRESHAGDGGAYIPTRITIGPREEDETCSTPEELEEYLSASW